MLGLLITAIYAQSSSVGKLILAWRRALFYQPAELSSEMKCSCNVHLAAGKVSIKDRVIGKGSN
jgi:hypothetical protein